MAKTLKEKEYILSISQFNTPKVLTHERAICMLLLRLILLEPGSNPLHPDMGVGIVNYRYAMGKLDELKTRVANQIETYLPEYPAGKVELDIDPVDHLCNIKIYIEDTIYVYDSREAPIPITIDTALDVV